jgi:hypothetical protein
MWVILIVKAMTLEYIGGNQGGLKGLSPLDINLLLFIL